MIGRAISLSIVIVSWNTRDLVLECLQSLEASHRNLSLEIFLVDNASSDGTAEIVEQKFPQVRVVKNETNLGFARANNIGMRLCTGDYVCLINSDVVVPEGCLETMARFMEGNVGIGMLGPKMRLADGSIGQSCMRFPTVWNWFCRALALDSLFPGSRMFGDFLMTGFSYQKTTDVDALTGWFWMVRREALEQVGLLDERFFMYGEDIDWPKRFHDADWRVVFYPEAEAIHHCGASSSKAPTRFYIEESRANMQYFRRHHGGLAVAGFWLATCLHQLVRISGYGMLYFFRRDRHEKIVFKIRRSVACLLWLAGLLAPEEAR